MLIGSHNHMLDEKKRIRIPFEYKDFIKSEVVMCVSVNGCIGVYSKEWFMKLVEKFSSDGMFDREKQKFATKFFTNSFEVSEDNQGRILLPEALRRYSGIEKAVTTVGKGDHLEIWATERLEALDQTMDFDEVFEEFNKAEKRMKEGV